MKKGNQQDGKTAIREDGEKKSERWEKNRKKNRQNAESGARKKMHVDERQRPALFASYHNTNLSQAIAIYNTDLSR
jgi:hypothetical protein